ECRSLRQTAQLDITDLGDFLAVDTQHRGGAVALIEIGALVPSKMTATATSPFGEMASPSGPSPTTTRSVMRIGLSSRSTTLTVSTLPSEEPAPPLSAVRAILPLGATATL